MKTSSWIYFCLASLLTVLGYFITLICYPSFLPPVLRLGGLTSPMTVLLLGVDIVYGTDKRYMAKGGTFKGRSDTIAIARFDPWRNGFSILSIPRDTRVHIPGYGWQKINAANALGGEQLAMKTVEELTGIPLKHYAVVNVHGLVELVDALGGIAVDVPKRMYYRDRTANLNIALEPGKQILNGTDSMGFVRFRHDALGDIARVQRQELFMKGTLERLLQPSSWAKVPACWQIAQNYVKTDLSFSQVIQILTFLRLVPKENHCLVMLPGGFSSTGGWVVNDPVATKAIERFLRKPARFVSKREICLSVENASSVPKLGWQLSSYLSSRGYTVVSTTNKPLLFSTPQSCSKIIAQCGNPEEARLIKQDLYNYGEVVNASLGNIQSTVTVVAGDDLIPVMRRCQSNL